MSRYGQTPNYLGDPYAEFAGKILTFSPEEISAGLTSSIIVILPTILLMYLFRKTVKGTTDESKNPSRFDKVVEEAAEEGKIILPDQSFKRNLRPGENDGNGNRKIDSLPPYCYLLAWGLTFLFICKSYFDQTFFSVFFLQYLAWLWSACMDCLLATTKPTSGLLQWL